MTDAIEVTRSQFDDLMVPCYAPAPMIPVRGEGSRVWDQEGREYLDLAAGIAVTCLGHAHPRLVRALKDQAERLWHVSNVFANEPALRLASQLCEATFAEKVFFANSGAEANEAALKLARRYASDQGMAGKNEIIAFDQAFHGRTLFTVSVGGQAKYTQGFEPLPGGITHRPYGDLEALARSMSERTCAVILEPIQGEGGVLVPSQEFVQGVRALCDQHGALLIFDEVQTGVGRTGHLYAYMGLNVTPDILSTAKGLGGGFPIGAILTRTEIAESFVVGTHGSTYGGNPLACAVASEVMSIVNDEALLSGVRAKHRRLVAGLERIANSLGIFDCIRGRGLLIGCQLAPAWRGRARDVLGAAREHGLLVLVAGQDVIRLAPSLIIPDHDIDDALRRLERSCHVIVETAQ